MLAKNHLQVLIEVVWVPGIEVDGSSRGHARYFAHLILILLLHLVSIQDFRFFKVNLTTCRYKYSTGWQIQEISSPLFNSF